jgi:hypothetical protein
MEEEKRINEEENTDSGAERDPQRAHEVLGLLVAPWKLLIIENISSSA